MPKKTTLTGHSIHVLDVPPIPGTNGKEGRAILLRDNEPPHDEIIFGMPESLAKDIGHKLVGQGRVRTATPAEVAKLGTSIENYSGAPKRV